MKYYLVDVISIWRLPSDFLQYRQTWRNWSFYHLLFTPFADIALFMLNRKKRRCDKYRNGVPNAKCQMSKTFTLFTVYFRHTIPSDYRYSIRMHKIVGPNPGPFSRRLEMSLCQPSRGWLPFLFWIIGKNEAAKREKLTRIPYALSKIHWASDPHCPPPPPYSH